MHNTDEAPAASIALEHEFKVAPVVTISSTNKTFLLLSLAGFPKKASSRFLNLSSRSNFTWDAVSFTLDTALVSNGIFNNSASG
jgi:hypothetical protein